MDKKLDVYQKLTIFTAVISLIIIFTGFIISTPINLTYKNQLLYNLMKYVRLMSKQKNIFLSSIPLKNYGAFVLYQT